MLLALDKRTVRCQHLVALYDEGPMPWSRVADTLGSGSIPPEVPCFLGTVRPNGRPHSAGVGVAQYEGDLYFTSGPKTRKLETWSCTMMRTASRATLGSW